MPDMIKDGHGNGGFLAGVDNKGRLTTYSVIEEESAFINRVEKQMYSGPFGSSVTAATAGNIIVYLKNTNTVKDLVIVTLKHRCETNDGTLAIWLNVTGTPGGSLTDITPGNRNAGSNNVADCTFQRSTDITGLSGGYLVGSIFGVAGQEFKKNIPASGFILPPNGTFALKADTKDSVHYGGMAFYFRDMVV